MPISRRTFLRGFSRWYRANGGCLPTRECRAACRSLQCSQPSRCHPRCLGNVTMASDERVRLTAPDRAENGSA